MKYIASKPQTRLYKKYKKCFLKNIVYIQFTTKTLTTLCRKSDIEEYIIAPFFYVHGHIFFDKFIVSNAFAQKLASQFLNTCICQNKFGENCEYLNIWKIKKNNWHMKFVKENLVKLIKRGLFEQLCWYCRFTADWEFPQISNGFFSLRER
jgi:hypothetical protein